MKEFPETRGSRANVGISRIVKTTGIPLMVVCLWCVAYARNPKMIEVDRTYDRREVTLEVGEVLELSLAENPTTGFRWGFAVKPEPACTIVKSIFEPAVGSPGKGAPTAGSSKPCATGTDKLNWNIGGPGKGDAGQSNL